MLLRFGSDLLVGYISQRLASSSRHSTTKAVLKFFNRVPQHFVDWGSAYKAKQTPCEPIAVFDMFKRYGIEAVSGWQANLSSVDCKDRYPEKAGFDKSVIP